MSNIFLIIFIFTLFKDISNTKPPFIFPFTKELNLNSNMNHSEIFKELENNNIYTNFKIGVPSQDIKYKIKGNTHITYLITNNTGYSKEVEKKIKLYFPKKSDTYQINSVLKNPLLNYQINYLIDDTFIFSNQTLKHFVTMEPFSNNLKDATPESAGILGLGIDNTIYDDDDYSGFYINFIKNLNNINAIGSYDFFFEFGDDLNGKLILGADPYEYNNKIYKNKANTMVKYPNYNNKIELGFYIGKMLYNDQIITGNYSFSLIRPESGLMIVGKDIFTLLNKTFFGELFEQNVCFSVDDIFSSESNMIYCKKDKINKSKLGVIKIFLEINDIAYNIDLSKLFYDYGEYTYFKIKFTNINDHIILGDYFLRDYLVIFNSDRKSIKVYSQVINNENNKKLIIIIIIVILLVISLIALLVYIYFKKFKKILIKKKGLELLSCDEDLIQK